MTREKTRGKPRVPAAIRACGRAPEGFDWVYSYYDREGDLLYVGITTDAVSRAYNHRSSKWWRFVATGEAFLAPVTSSGYTEYRQIRERAPLFNVAHSIIDEDWAAEYCARREAWDLVDEYLHWYEFDVKAGIREPVA